jgi:hypothetical protein
MPNCGWNCQLAVGDNRPVPYPLAVILDHLVGSNAPGRCASGSHNSICFLSSDERRIAPQFRDFRWASNVRFESMADITYLRPMSALPPKANMDQHSRDVR